MSAPVRGPRSVRVLASGRAVLASRATWIWGVAVVAYLMAVTGRSSLAATGAVAAERFAVSSGVLSLLAVLQLAVYAALQIPAGVLVDRIGPRRLIAAGAALVAVGQLVLALTTVFGLAILGRVLVGAGDAVTFVSVLRLIPAWFAPRRVPVLNQLTGILGQLGQVVSAVPFAAAVVGVGWTPAFLAASGTALLTAVLAVAVLRDGPSRVGGDGAAAPRDGSLATVVRAPSTRLGFWCHFASPFTTNMFGLLWGFPFLVAEGLTPAAASGLITVVVVTGILAGPVVGVLAARHPARRVTMVVAVVALQMATWAAVLFWPGPVPAAALVVLAVVVGLGGPASLVAFDIARAGVAPDQVGRASGVTNVGGFAATIVVVLLVGLALDLQGAGRPELWTPQAFETAMLVQFPVWTVGLIGIARCHRLGSSPTRLASGRWRIRRTR